MAMYPGLPLTSAYLEQLPAGLDSYPEAMVKGSFIRAIVKERPDGFDPSVLPPELASVFLTPPSMEELERRLRTRGEDDEATIQKRLALARHEIDQWSEFDYLLISETVNADAPEKDEDLRRMLP